MGIPFVIVIGALVGTIASLITGRRWGILRDIGIGIVGALGGGVIARIWGFGFIRGFDIRNLGMAAGGAIVLVLVVMVPRLRRAY